jgi:hypothetical protein
MAERARRQTRRRTRVQLQRTLSSDGRAWVKEVWDATEIERSQLPPLEPLPRAIASHLVENHPATLTFDGREIADALHEAVLVGYTARSVLAGPTDQPQLDRASLPGGTAGAIPLDPQRDRSGVIELARWLAAIAAENLDSVMTLPEPVWSAYIALAAMQLQRRLCTETLTWRELTAERIEEMLRVGYVLRCLEEALERGVTRAQRPTGV